MADYTPPLRDIRFVLDAVFKVKDRWSQWPALAEVVDGETADAILEEAGKLCAQNWRRSIAIPMKKAATGKPVK